MDTSEAVFAAKCFRIPNARTSAYSDLKLKEQIVQHFSQFLDQNVFINVHVLQNPYVIDGQYNCTEFFFIF